MASIGKLIESGQITRMSKRWIVEPGNECNPTETNPMAMQNVVLTFVIIGMAFVVSLIILVIELLVSCCASRYLLRCILGFICSFYRHFKYAYRKIYNNNHYFYFQAKKTNLQILKTNKENWTEES